MGSGLRNAVRRDSLAKAQLIQEATREDNNHAANSGVEGPHRTDEIKWIGGRASPDCVPWQIK